MALSVEAEKERFDGIKSDLAFQKVSLPHEQVNSIEKDHSYDTVCNWWAVKAMAKPMKFIFGAYKTRSPDEPHPSQLVFDDKTYDMNMKTRKMNETMGYNQEDSESDESKGEKKGRGKDDIPERLSDLEQELWDKAIDYLNSYKLARIVHNGHKNELIWRKLVVEKVAKRFRNLFLHNIAKNAHVLRWLHNKLLDEIDDYFLQVYVEICQYLRRKIPGTMKHVFSNPTTKRLDTSRAFKDNPWDPITPQVHSRQLKSLRGSPILVLVPGLRGSTQLFKRWEQHLTGLGSLYAVNFCNIKGATVSKNLEKTVMALKQKLRKLKEDHPEKRLILVGFKTGAAMACQVAQKERVSAVVCLGFPSRTLNGCRGVGRDVITKHPSPILFIMGENASTSNVEEMELLRKRINAGTSLVVVNGGDDDLRLSNNSLMKEGVTQTIVDRCVVEEMVEFLEIVNLYPENFVKFPYLLPASKKLGNNDCASSETGEAATIKINDDTVGEARGSAFNKDDFIGSMDSEVRSSLDDTVNSLLEASVETIRETTLKETFKTPIKRPRGRGRGGANRGPREAKPLDTKETSKGEFSGETSGADAKRGIRGRRGRKRSEFCPYAPRDSSKYEGGFKRPNPPKQQFPIGSLINPRNEIADCDSYIDNLLEIMKLEDLMNSTATSSVQEDEDALAQILQLDDFI